MRVPAHIAHNVNFLPHPNRCAQSLRQQPGSICAGTGVHVHLHLYMPQPVMVPAVRPSFKPGCSRTTTCLSGSYSQCFLPFACALDARVRFQDFSHHQLLAQIQGSWVSCANRYRGRQKRETTAFLSKRPMAYEKLLALLYHSRGHSQVSRASARRGCNCSTSELQKYQHRVTDSLPCAWRQESTTAVQHGTVTALCCIWHQMTQEGAGHYRLQYWVVELGDQNEVRL